MWCHFCSCTASTIRIRILRCCLSHISNKRLARLMGRSVSSSSFLITAGSMGSGPGHSYNSTLAAVIFMYCAGAISRGAVRLQTASSSRGCAVNVFFLVGLVSLPEPSMPKNTLSRPGPLPKSKIRALLVNISKWTQKEKARRLRNSTSDSNSSSFVSPKRMNCSAGGGESNNICGTWFI